MNKRKKQIMLFVLVALVQLFVPAKMVWNQEDILKNGAEYKFKTAPFDPNDPFRGKYITLSFDNNTFEVENKTDWNQGDPIYVSFVTGNEGFAKIASISQEKPSEHHAFVKAKVGFVTSNRSNQLSIDYPFNRFYMEETKAYDAELTYRRSQLDSTKTTFALVYIKNGEAVIKDVLIDGVSINKIVQQENSKTEAKK